MRIDLSCPVENRGVTVKTNSTTNEPYALFRLFNLSDKVVDCVKFVARVYDAYGKELGAIPVEFTELEGQPKSPFAVNKGVSLVDFAEAKHVVADICEVIFSDGEIYTVSEENMTEINYIQPEYDEVTRLKNAAGNDAMCYAQDPGPYWLCVCSRPNKQEDSVCRRCGREKQMTLAKFSSHDKINKALEEKRLAEEAAEQERLAEEALQKEMKKKKTIKKLVTVLCCVACVAVLALIGWFSYRFVVTKIADGKVEKGEYFEAYKMYRSVGSSHIGNASEKVKGNSFSNLIQSGIMTADEEHIYYVNNKLNIIKENKQTGETMQLGEARGVNLCISDDWLYFADPMNGALSRIKTDGSITESVTDEPLSFYITIGEELYYLAADTDTEQSAENTPSAMALYCMNMDSKKVKKISTIQFYSLDFYKGNIYYIDAAQDHKLYAMDMNGKNSRLLVDQPVYGFAILDDVIYFSNGNMQEGATMPDLTLEKVNLDGTERETLVSDKTVALITAQPEGIYFTSYDDGALYRYTLESKQVETLPVSGFNMHNIADGYICYMNANGEMVRVKVDGSDELNMGMLNIIGGATTAE